MKKLIDAARAAEVISQRFGIQLSELVDVMAEIPSETVLCCECEHRGTFGCPMYYEEDVDYDYDGYHETDTIYHDRTNDNDYCSRGERRKE